MLEQIIITALTVLFFHACTTKGQVLHVVEKTLQDLPDWLQKPLYSCPVCMSMWWGPVVVACGIVWMDWQVPNAVQMFGICMAAGGLNFAIVKLTPEKNKTCDCDRKKRLGIS